MEDLTNLEKIINSTNSKIEARNEFKNAYNKQLAFDFDLFNFLKLRD